jgi:hypothetical protein
LRCGLSGDDFTLYAGAGSSNLVRYYQNDLIANLSLSAGSELWSPLYNNIFVCNAAIEGLTLSKSITPLVKQQLMGEAKFMRAFFYFYLVNLFGDVPYASSTDAKVNESLTRAPVAEIYQHIIADLQEAKTLLSAEYMDANLQPYTGLPERVRPNRWAATALLARVYLFTGDYSDAEIESTSLIDNASLFALDDLDNVFLKNSNEAIWQLQPIAIDHNTEEALLFIIPPTGPSDVGDGDHPVYLNDDLLASFETGDERLGHWIDSITVSGTTYYYPYKYKVNAIGSDVSEYLMVLRLGEQYLIRAEARAHLNKIEECQEDVNAIRNRAGLGDTEANDVDALLEEIAKQRRAELFSEWGHRWLDLKRTNTVDSVMSVASVQKGGSWTADDALYPIPVSDMEMDRNLTQNPGY